MARLKPDQRRALRLHAGSQHGYTESIMLAYDFNDEMLAVLVRDGLATSRRPCMPGSDRSPNDIDADQATRREAIPWPRLTESPRRSNLVKL
jgi:hypothetical protein